MVFIHPHGLPTGQGRIRSDISRIYDEHDFDDNAPIHIGLRGVPRRFHEGGAQATSRGHNDYIHERNTDMAAVEHIQPGSLKSPNPKFHSTDWEVQLGTERRVGLCAENKGETERGPKLTRILKGSHQGSTKCARGGSGTNHGG
eukprot:8467627-Pyramimonas_sp.AAC.1